MHMGHFKPCHNQANSLMLKILLLGSRNLLREFHQVGVQINWKFNPVVNFHTRDNQGVSLGNRVDRHESNAVLVLPDEVPWEFALNDFCKNCSHMLPLFGSENIEILFLCQTCLQ